MPKSKFIPPRAPGQYDQDAASRESALACPEPTRTQQHQADETDINLIVRRYIQTGVLPQAALEPLYGDFETLDFHTAQNRLRAAQEAFLRIPAEIRARFENDPGKFIEFASNPENADELVKLKLRDPPPRNDPPPGLPTRENPAPVPPNPTPQG